MIIILFSLLLILVVWNTKNQYAKQLKKKISVLENEMVQNHTEIMNLMNPNLELESMLRSVTQHYSGQYCKA